MCRGVGPGVGVMTPWKYVGGVRVCFDSPENVTFFYSKLLLHNSKFHSIKNEHLDIITSLNLFILTMLPSLCLISSKQTVSSDQCCSTGGKLSWPKTKLQNVGACDRSSTILVDHAAHMLSFPQCWSTARVAHQGRRSWGLGGSDSRKICRKGQVTRRQQSS